MPRTRSPVLLSRIISWAQLTVYVDRIERPEFVLTGRQGCAILEYKSSPECIPMKRMVPLQQAHRMLAARPVCLVTTMLKGRVNVMPLAWHCPVSIDPPLVAIAVHPTSYTHELLRQHEECVLNIPGRPMLEAVLACGSVSGRT